MDHNLTINAWNMESKIVRYEDIQKVIERERLKSSVIVFTNGCFDLIHLGHIEILKESRKMGDCLIVGLNADQSVKRLKGTSRPVQDEKTRAVILSALLMVDYVVVFNEDTPLELIKKIEPDVLVKGGDYTIEQVVGAEYVIEKGGNVRIITILPGHSTTSTIERMI